jgi:hypothetical protein
MCPRFVGKITSSRGAISNGPHTLATAMGRYKSGGARFQNGNAVIGVAAGDRPLFALEPAISNNLHHQIHTGGYGTMRQLGALAKSAALAVKTY